MTARPAAGPDTTASSATTSPLVRVNNPLTGRRAATSDRTPTCGPSRIAVPPRAGRRRRAAGRRSARAGASARCHRAVGAPPAGRPRRRRGTAARAGARRGPRAGRGRSSSPPAECPRLSRPGPAGRGRPPHQTGLGAEGGGHDARLRPVPASGQGPPEGLPGRPQQQLAGLADAAADDEGAGVEGRREVRQADAQPAADLVEQVDGARGRPRAPLR